MIGVYAIRHIASQRVYVGSSINIHKRWAGHVRSLERGRHNSRYLQHAWMKYGSAAFEFVVLEVCMPEERIECEQAYIDRYHAADPVFGFNLSATAGLTTLNAESRAKLAVSVSRARTGRKFGPRDPEVGRKIAASLRGKPLSEERKQKIAAAHQGKKRGPHSEIHRRRIGVANTGKTHTLESKAKMAAAKRGRSLSPETRLKMVAARRSYLSLVKQQAQKEGVA